MTGSIRRAHDVTWVHKLAMLKNDAGLQPETAIKTWNPQHLIDIIGQRWAVLNLFSLPQHLIDIIGQHYSSMPEHQTALQRIHWQTRNLLLARNPDMTSPVTTLGASHTGYKERLWWYCSACAARNCVYRWECWKCGAGRYNLKIGTFQS